MESEVRHRKHRRHHAIPNPEFERFCLIFGPKLAQEMPELTKEELLRAMKVMYRAAPEWMVPNRT